MRDCMGERATLRPIGAIALALFLASCQPIADDLFVRLTGAHEQAFFDAMQSFAKRGGFQVVSGDFVPRAYTRIDMGNWASTIWVERSQRCGVRVFFQDK